jgi:flagellar hook assembly protein FlgD
VFTATDASGNTTVVTRTVLVPKNQTDKVIIGTGTELLGRGFASTASPNPFGSSTTIGFRLAATAAVRIGIYDGLGNEVALVLDAELTSGAHEAVWSGQRSDGTAAASGHYYYRIQSQGISETGIVMLVR